MTFNSKASFADNLARDVRIVPRVCVCRVESLPILDTLEPWQELRSLTSTRTEQ